VIWTTHKRHLAAALAAAWLFTAAAAAEDVSRPPGTPPAGAAPADPGAEADAGDDAGAPARDPWYRTDIHPKLKIEARLDAGDLAAAPDGATWATGGDAYVKKIRFGVAGRLLSRGKYALLVEAEHLGQDARKPAVKLDRAYVEYAFAGALALRAGRAKLPLSRGSLLSSSDVFLRDAATVDAMDDLFGDDTQRNVQLRGTLNGGVVGYAAAVAEGWRRGEAIHRTAGAGFVEAAQPLLVARLDLAVPGFTQPLEETRPGAGRRVSFGWSFSTQRGIRYAGGGGEEDRALFSMDVTARLGPFSAVVEGDAWRIQSSVPDVGAKSPFGGYAQLAWLVAGPRLEPKVRYDALQESADPAATQQTLSLGVNWYPRRDGARVAVDLVHQEFGATSKGRLDQASARDLVQVGAEVSF
jgi:hypothetical protein